MCSLKGILATQTVSFVLHLWGLDTAYLIAVNIIAVKYKTSKQNIEKIGFRAASNRLQMFIVTMVFIFLNISCFVDVTLARSCLFYDSTKSLKVKNFIES